MIKKILFPLFIILVSCNAPEPPANTVKTKSPSKPKPEASKPVPSPWLVRNYVDSNGESTERKYLRFDADGTFSDQTVSNNYIHAVILVNKENAGILLHRFKRSNPPEKFTGPVQIKIKNSAGNELEMISSRGWNKSGGTLIEQNNNDYSRFRIFVLQSEGVINVEIQCDSSPVYRFNIDATGFGDSLSQI
ncbi:MAG TPA: hypothetical protein VMV47_09545 [Bacteroidales bacterium]|nr:hypothetical protein [Bacteroidales bacterium]